MNNLDIEAWQSKSIFYQLGNIGSEVGRAAKYFTNSQMGEFQSSLCRVDELFEATTDILIRTNPARAREVLLARDQFYSQFFSDTPVIDPGIETYFNQFAFAYQLHR